jgi:2,4-dienoyl-CoA reductase-like NADH-dependent reductase (Old Yellow Enzyme family)
VSAGAFARLLSPTAIGSLELRNRIALCPMGVNLGERDGSVGDPLTAWFEARARGGTGLVIVGSAGVAYPAGSYDARQVALSDDRFLPGLRRLTRTVHAHGAAIAAQLVHDGTQSLLDVAEGRPLLVPSKRRPPAPDELSTMLTPDEVDGTMAPFTTRSSRLEYAVATEDDLVWVIDRFADAAARAVAAGFDGVELHAGHGYLLDAFLSPATNSRADTWGGDARGRARLLVEVVRAVRAAVGPTFPVWARIGTRELHRSPAQTLDDALVAIDAAVGAGLDAVHATAYAEPMVATGITDGHTPHDPGALLPLAAAVRAAARVPVIAMGRLTPEAAEHALADGAADVIAFGRPLIADPDLPAKLAAGRRDRVRPCAYQYRCIGSIFVGDSLRCTVNPDAGHEAEVRFPAPGDRRRVLVVGGGPAGLEAARRLAEQGHGVELWEATDRLGGLLRMAELADPDLLGLADWLAGSAVDAGVVVRPGVPADAASVAAAGVDLVVWAAGTTWASTPGTTTPSELAGFLAGDDGSLGTSMLVVGSSKAALSIARAVARTGRRVVLASPDAVVAPELGLPGRFRAVADARREGVDLRLSTPLESVDHSGFDDIVVVERAAPVVPDLGDVAVAVLGDATGEFGLLSAFAGARTLALPVAIRGSQRR